MDFSRLDRKVIPAIPTWFKADEAIAELDLSINRKYIKKLLDTPIGGVAALVHTGRGNFLSEEERRIYLKMCSEIVHESGKILITGVKNEVDAKMAAECGVDAVLVFPNREELGSLDNPDRMKIIISHHQKIARIHQNCIIFLLYEATGIGIVYTQEEIRKLLSIENISGIKFALLSDFERLEDILASLLSLDKKFVLFTGEDRMFAESVEKVRDLTLRPDCCLKNTIRVNSLIGLGSALPWLQTFMLRNYDNPDHQRDYFRARALISDLARNTFVRPRSENTESPDYRLPMEPYIMNMSVASGFQFGIGKHYIGDIALIKDERKKRGIPDIIARSLNGFHVVKQQQKIIDIVNRGLKLEHEFKNKYGLKI